MNRLFKIIFSGLLVVFFAGCSDKYEQNYTTYKDFNNANLRNKSWFPDIISSDAYNLKNTSYLDSLCAFGTFNYSENNFYDSLFKNPKTKQITFSFFEQKVNEHSNRKPGWFLNFKEISEINFETIQLEQFYITRDAKERKIYFILTN